MNLYVILHNLNISGAFEINGRLMHARDGLALWDVNSIEIEALSAEATYSALNYLIRRFQK